MTPRADQKILSTEDLSSNRSCLELFLFIFYLLLCPFLWMRFQELGQLLFELYLFFFICFFIGLLLFLVELVPDPADNAHQACR